MVTEKQISTLPLLVNSEKAGRNVYPISNTDSLSTIPGEFHPNISLLDVLEPPQDRNVAYCNRLCATLCLPGGDLVTFFLRLRHSENRSLSDATHRNLWTAHKL